MKAWITKGRNIAAVAALLYILAPASAFAAVQFTEVMYDVPGADTGHEWLEVTNTGSASVDLTGYKFFQGGVNHGMSVVQGTTTLAAGESAVIAANTTKFLADYPAYAGVLFKSSFTLTNTGESVSLKDKALAVVDSLTYSSSMGANGDGNSLHLSNGSWISGAPNPGSNAPSAAIKKAVSVSAATTKTTTQTSASSVKKSPATSGTFNVSSETGGTLSAASMGPLLQNIPSVYVYVLGLVALIALGVGAVFYAKPQASTASAVTEGSEEEFELE